MCVCTCVCSATYVEREFTPIFRRKAISGNEVDSPLTKRERGLRFSKKHSVSLSRSLSSRYLFIRRSKDVAILQKSQASHTVYLPPISLDIARVKLTKRRRGTNDHRYPCPFRIKVASVNKRECRSRWARRRVACTRKNGRTGVKSGGGAKHAVRPKRANLVHIHTYTGRLYFPVGLISIIRKRITHSLHAPSTWSVSLHSPHSPNSRYPLTRVAHLRSRHSLNLLLSPPFFVSAGENHHRRSFSRSCSHRATCPCATDVLTCILLYVFFSLRSSFSVEWRRDAKKTRHQEPRNRRAIRVREISGQSSSPSTPLAVYPSVSIHTLLVHRLIVLFSHFLV